MESIVSSLIYFAESQPEALAFIQGRKQITYGALRGDVEAAAAWLHNAGIRRGETVALSLDWTWRSLSLFYGLAYLGAIVLPLYPIGPVESQNAVVEQLKARYLISARARRPITNVRRIDPPDFERSEFRTPGTLPPRGDEPDQPFLYHFTSGTTGNHKTVLYTFRQFSAWVLSNVNPFRSTSADRHVPAIPWPTKVGIRDLFRIHVFGGALVNAPFPKTREELASLIRDFGVTQLSASPSQLRLLLQSEGLKGLRLPPLRVLSVAGAITTPEEIRACRELITPNVYVDYGCNEFGMIACLRPEDTALVEGMVGKLLPGIEGQAVDDNDVPLPVGEIGKLRFRSPGMVHGYVGNEETTALHFRHGWFYPGDVGLIDAEQTVILKGRVDDIITVGGVKVAPAIIEPALKRHPDVADVALVGVPDPIAGQQAVAFVVLRRSLSATDLFSVWAKWVGRSDLPRDVVSVPEIPRNPEGKILRDRLRDMYFARLAKRMGPESESGS